MPYTSLFDRHGLLIWTNYHPGQQEPPINEGTPAWDLVDPRDSERVQEACGKVLMSKRPRHLVGRRDNQLFEATLLFAGATELVAHWHWHKPGLLTEREVEILALICAGDTLTEIARKLHIKASTVDAHKAHLKEKTGCNGTAQLVRWSIRHGYLQA